jgi:hypothetical protein
MKSWYSSWSHEKLHVVIALTLIIICGIPSMGWTYSKETHHRIVMHAVDFIIKSRDKTSPYVDGSTGQSDHTLLRSVFPKADDHMLGEIGKEMGQASADTDDRSDIWLNIPWLYFWSTPQAGVGSVSFSTFSHFINVRNPGSAWEFSGYYYGWVKANQKCSDAGFEDIIANFFVGNSQALVDIKKSEAFTIYKNPLHSKITDAQYQALIEQDIEHVHFWPITNIADYWLEKFRREPQAADGGPYNLAWIGPVLHAAGDSTVPYHAAGLSGCGHGAYEARVETTYDSLYDRDAVQTLLESEKHLDHRLPVVGIITGNARRAADPRFCKCNLNACDCPVVRDSTAARELVNLAIASTVVLLRKAFFEWEANKGSQPIQQNVRQKIVIDKESRTISSTAELATEEIFVQPLKSGDARPLVDSLKVELSRLRDIINDLEMGRNTNIARRALQSKVDDISRVVSKHPTFEWNPLFIPPRKLEYSSSFVIGSRPIQFRLPTQDELFGDGWTRYIQQRRRFFAARGLYITALTRAAIMGRRSRIPRNQQPKADEYINNLRKAEEQSITLLIP